MSASQVIRLAELCIIRNEKENLSNIVQLRIAINSVISVEGEELFQELSNKVLGFSGEHEGVEVSDTDLNSMGLGRI